LLLLIALAIAATTVGAQQDVLSDEEIAAQHEVVIRSRTLVPGGVNTVVEIPVLADSFVASGAPSTNFGLDPYLRVGYDLGSLEAMRPLFKFSLSVIPPDSVINSALFQIYQVQATPANDSPMGSVARHLTADWNPNLVTWNSHLPNWGGIFTTVYITNINGWKQTEVTDVVQEWYSGVHPNNGAIIVGDETPQERYRVFYSQNGPSGFYPRLIVDYTVFDDDIPPTATVNPLPTYSPATFNVSWTGTDNPGGSGIAYYDVQYSINGGAWVNWQMHTVATSATFSGGQNGQLYLFRARAVDLAGNIQAWTAAQTQTRVDAIAPTANVNPLPQFTFTPTFIVSWTGTDNSGGSGIASFSVQYRIGDGDWQSWFTNVTATSAQFTGAENGQIYYFRARATDVAGNIQPWSETAQAQTTVMFEPISYVLQPIPPFVRPTDPITDSFELSWAGFTAPGTTIVAYDVQYRFDGGPWIPWLQDTVNTSATFVIPNAEDGIYEFEVRALNSLGQQEPYTGTPEAFMIVDLQEPYVLPAAFLPIAIKLSEG
jgi:hypothetical protein